MAVVSFETTKWPHTFSSWLPPAVTSRRRRCCVSSVTQQRLRQLSQQALAETADVSRRMLVGIESGDANVSLNTLDRIAEALQVSFADLVKAPARDLRRIEALAWSGSTPGSQAVLLATAPAAHDVELWAWTLMPGDRYTSGADPAGWHEMFYVMDGQLTVELPSGEQVIDAGDFFVFPSDCRYAYRNDGQTPLRFIRNVVH